MLFLYCLLGPVTWLLLGVAMGLGRKRLLLVRRPGHALPDPPPRVSLLIPAKDEGERMRACLESVIAQDYPSYSVICIDDRSTDQTGRIMDEFAARDSRVRAFHVREGSLPAGWTGKCNALHSHVRHADGEWLLFVDSDVILEPDAVRLTMDFAVRKDVHLFSLLPRLESHSLWESLLVPLAATSMSTMYLIALSNHNHKMNNAFANGQFLLIRRKTYDAIGGHEQVKDHFCEDVRLARLLKRAGYKIRVAWGNHLAAVRMYSSLEQIFRGWSRLFYAVGVGSPWRIIGGMIFTVECGLSAYAAGAWAIGRVAMGAGPLGWWWLIAAALHLVFMTVLLALIYRWSGNPGRNALLFPLAAVMLLGIYIKSLRLCATGQLEWRGTRYSHRMSMESPPLQ